MQKVRYFWGSSFIVLGLFFLKFRHNISQIAIKRWYDAFPNYKIWEKGYDVFIFAGSIVFILFGVLTILGIIKLK